MNFLGHIYFSGNDESIIFGNILGDFVKGNIDKTMYSEKIKSGLKLHRKIDGLADDAINFKKTKARIRDELGLYSGAVTDIYYDHFLSKHWQELYKTDLELHSKKIYKIIDKHENYFTENFRTMFYYMKKYNWLYNYKNLCFIDKVFNGMADRKIKREILRFSGKLLRDNYNEIEHDFFNFMNEMQKNFNKGE